MKGIKKLNNWLNEFFSSDIPHLVFGTPTHYTVFVNPAIKLVKLRLGYKEAKIEIRVCSTSVELRGIAGIFEEVIMFNLTKKGEYYPKFLKLAKELLEEEASDIS